MIVLLSLLSLLLHCRLACVCLATSPLNFGELFSFGRVAMFNGDTIHFIAVNEASVCYSVKHGVAMVLSPHASDVWMSGFVGVFNLSCATSCQGTCIVPTFSSE